MGGNIQVLMVDNINGKSVGALAYKVPVRAHFFMLDKAFTCYLLHNMFFKQQEIMHWLQTSRWIKPKHPTGLEKKFHIR